MTGVSNRRECVEGHHEDSGTHATLMLLAHSILLSLSVYAGVRSWNLGFMIYKIRKSLTPAAYSARHTYRPTTYIPFIPPAKEG